MALILSVMVLLFAVLLMLSLTALVQVKSRTSKATDRLIRARENARLGLMVALGKLQKYAGPDQRVTATAEILDDVTVARYGSDPPPGQAGTVKVNVSDGKRYWTGVWESSVRRYTAQGQANGLLKRNDGTGAGQFHTAPLVWLVSGGAERAQIEGGTANGSEVKAVTPDVYPALVDANSGVVSGSVVDAGDHVVLVGGGSTDVAVDPSHAVVVPKVSMMTSQGQEVGRYAYWVGDEGVKARLNLVEVSDLPSGDEERCFFPVRTGWEVRW